MFTKDQQLKQNKKPKRKRCKNCRKLFVPDRDMQSTCSYLCAIEYAKNEKNQRKYINDRKRTFKRNNPNKSDLKAKAQKIVNEYVRLRDSKKGCISCETKEAKFDSGHYRPQGNNQQLRYNTLNIHKQCYRCNRLLSANLQPYRVELVNRIGLKKVEWLESNQETKKYSVEYLERLITVFRKKIKLYKKKFR